MTLTITGKPRTKKTHSRIIRNRRTGAPLLIPSKTSVDWERDAVDQLRRRWNQSPVHQAYSVSVRALIYRDANRGDLCGYLQAIGDALQGGGSRKKRIPCVLTDDAQIKSWDGSRLLVDKESPRVEIELTLMSGDPDVAG